MKAYQFLCFFLIVASSLQSCKSSKNVANKNQRSPEQVFLFQNGRQILLSDLNQTVQVSKENFSIRFYNKRYNAENKEFYSAQIAAFLEKSELDKIELGMLKSDLACFAPGTGMAPSRSGKYERLVFNNNAHHYTMYENSYSKRLNLIEESGEFQKLEFEILGLYYDNKEIKMTDADLTEFYIAFLIDRNLNGKIDAGELKKLTINIK